MKLLFTVSMYYARFERQELVQVGIGSQDLLMRLVDDFLLITPHQNTAISFLDVMSKGHDEFGCFINEKTVTNFDYRDIPGDTIQGKFLPLIL